jgi:hypothetical protein
MHISLKNPFRQALRVLLPAAVITVFSIATAASPALRQATSSQQVGTLNASVRVAASAGEPEPGRGLTLYLLRKSFEDICKQADAAEAPLDMDAFIDKLEVSPELKTWMKKHKMVELSGPTFPKALTADDIFNVKEFSEAFGSRTSGDVSVQMPTAKYLKVNRQKQPEKYQQLLDEYHRQLRLVIQLHPELLDTLYIALDQDNLDPGPRWAKMEMERTARVHRRGLALAQSEFLVATATTDLDGRCTFGTVPAGSYWVSTLDVEALAGDAHLRWDVPTRVPAGQSATVQLSSVNGIVPGQ